MTNDESPVDVAAHNAAPPVDDAPQADSAAEPDAVPASTPARRRTSASRSSRARKPATASNSPTPPVQEHATHGTAEPSPAVAPVSLELEAPVACTASATSTTGKERQTKPARGTRRT